MVLKVFDQNKTFAGHLVDLSDVSIEHNLESGDKLLSFSVPAKTNIKNEYYVQTDKAEYVVKEVRPGEDSWSIVAQINLEELEAVPFDEFKAEEKTTTEMAALALAGTGWTVESDMDKKRNVRVLDATPLDVLKKIRDAFMCDIAFDSLNKKVYLKDSIGSYKGVYLMKGLNLTELMPTYDSYDYYTRLIPIGKDGLSIEDVNPTGKKYVENYQYSNKVRTLVWEDSSYESAEALMSDAVDKLEDLSRPKISYSAKVSDLAAQSSRYGVLSFSIGDTVDIIDESLDVMDKQKIVKLTEYPLEPQNNTCELSNTVLTWEELQDKLQAAADAWDDSTNSDGTIKGVRVEGVVADGVVGLDIKINEGVSDNSTVKKAVSDISSLESRVGSVETTYLKATEADIKYAEIDFANVGVANIKEFFAKSGTITDLTVVDATIRGTLTGVKVKAQDIDVTTLTAAQANLAYAKIDFSEIDIAKIGELFAKSGVIKDLVTQSGSVTGELVGVTIKGDLIEANTLVADKIVIKGNDGLFYKLNTTGETVEAQQTNANSLNGSVITAKTITAEKVNVSDLVAFDATIGGFKITEDAIYSVGKSTKSSTGAGIYLDSDGNANFGDGDQYLKFVDGYLGFKTYNFQVTDDDEWGDHVQIGNISDNFYTDISREGFSYIYNGRSGFEVKAPSTGSFNVKYVNGASINDDGSIKAAFFITGLGDVDDGYTITFHGKTYYRYQTQTEGYVYLFKYDKNDTNFRTGLLHNGTIYTESNGGYFIHVNTSKITMVEDTEPVEYTESELKEILKESIEYTYEDPYMIFANNPQYKYVDGKRIIGKYSAIFGSSGSTKGDYAFSAGVGCDAYGYGSMAVGNGTHTDEDSFGQFVCGSNNEMNSDAVFQVGNGGDLSGSGHTAIEVTRTDSDAGGGETIVYDTFRVVEEIPDEDAPIGGYAKKKVELLSVNPETYDDMGLKENDAEIKTSALLNAAGGLSFSGREVIPFWVTSGGTLTIASTYPSGSSNHVGGLVVAEANGGGFMGLVRSGGWNAIVNTNNWKCSYNSNTNTRTTTWTITASAWSGGFFIPFNNGITNTITTT